MIQCKYLILIIYAGSAFFGTAHLHCAINLLARPKLAPIHKPGPDEIGTGTHFNLAVAIN